MGASKHIGIMSMQRIRNYGSFLQAYALKTMVEDLGNTVEFVDYKVEPPVFKDSSKKGAMQKIKDVFASDAPFIQKLQYLNHKKNYDKKYLGLLGLTGNLNLRPKLDTLVIGSDEVFNCIQANKNVGYSLELFGKNNNAKKVITYAASFGNTTIDKLSRYKKSEEISKLLLKMDKISVRDANSQKIVKELTGDAPAVNLDPVLVFDYMNRISIPIIKHNEKYMIVYAYSGRITKEESSVIKKYAKDKNLKIYAIGGAQKCADKFIDCSPFEVLSYFKFAECIVTDTFHGSIFSIINNKPFITLVRKSIGASYGNEEKLKDLLERLGLIDRATYDVKTISEQMSEGINYNVVNNILAKERKNTMEYLRKEL